MENNKSGKSAQNNTGGEMRREKVELSAKKMLEQWKNFLDEQFSEDPSKRKGEQKSDMSSGFQSQSQAEEETLVLEMIHKLFDPMLKILKSSQYFYYSEVTKEIDKLTKDLKKKFPTYFSPENKSTKVITQFSKLSNHIKKKNLENKQRKEEIENKIYTAFGSMWKSEFQTLKSMAEKHCPEPVEWMTDCKKVYKYHFDSLIKSIASSTSPAYDLQFQKECGEISWKRTDSVCTATKSTSSFINEYSDKMALELEKNVCFALESDFTQLHENTIIDIYNKIYSQIVVKKFEFVWTQLDDFTKTLLLEYEKKLRVENHLVRKLQAEIAEKAKDFALTKYKNFMNNATRQEPGIFKASEILNFHNEAHQKIKTCFNGIPGFKYTFSWEKSWEEIDKELKELEKSYLDKNQHKIEKIILQRKNSMAAAANEYQRLINNSISRASQGKSIELTELDNFHEEGVKRALELYGKKMEGVQGDGEKYKETLISKFLDIRQQLMRENDEKIAREIREKEEQEKKEHQNKRKPLQLIGFQNGILKWNTSTWNFLQSQIPEDNEIAIIGIVGSPRAGKSLTANYIVEYLENHQKPRYNWLKTWEDENDPKYVEEIISGGSSFERFPVGTKGPIFNYSDPDFTPGIYVWLVESTIEREGKPPLSVLVLDVHWSLKMNELRPNVYGPLIDFVFLASSLVVYVDTLAHWKSKESLELWIPSQSAVFKLPEKFFQTCHYILRGWNEPEKHKFGSKYGQNFLKDNTKNDSLFYDHAQELTVFLQDQFQEFSFHLLPESNAEYSRILREKSQEFIKYFTSFVNTDLDVEELNPGIGRWGESKKKNLTVKNLEQFLQLPMNIVHIASFETSVETPLPVDEDDNDIKDESQNTEIDDDYGKIPETKNSEPKEKEGFVFVSMPENSELKAEIKEPVRNETDGSTSMKSETRIHPDITKLNLNENYAQTNPKNPQNNISQQQIISPPPYPYSSAFSLLSQPQLPSSSFSSSTSEPVSARKKISISKAFSSSTTESVSVSMKTPIGKQSSTANVKATVVDSGESEELRQCKNELKLYIQEVKSQLEKSQGTSKLMRDQIEELIQEIDKVLNSTEPVEAALLRSYGEKLKIRAKRIK